MKMIRIRLTILLAICALSAGCKSLVYSPSLILPAEPLRKDQGQLAGELGLLAETSPQSIGRYAVAGGNLLVRYGFSDRVSLGVKTWADLPELGNGGYRGGVSAEATVMLTGDNAPYRFALMPRAAALISTNRSIDGLGMILPVALWTPKVWLFRPYLGLGGVIGFHDLSTNPPQWGYGAIGNIGAAVDLADRLAMNLEVAALVQHSHTEGATNGVAVPSLALSWSF